VRQQVPGEVLRVRFGKSQGSLQYRITVLTDEGRYREVVVDAEKSKIVSMRWR
jgi:uncharacterized membrane protein YkoI